MRHLFFVGTQAAYQASHTKRLTRTLTLTDKHTLYIINILMDAIAHMHRSPRPMCTHERLITSSATQMKRLGLGWARLSGMTLSERAADVGYRTNLLTIIYRIITQRRSREGGEGETNMNILDKLNQQQQEQATRSTECEREASSNGCPTDCTTHCLPIHPAPSTRKTQHVR
jgi:hypothetical protein